MTNNIFVKKLFVVIGALSALVLGEFSATSQALADGTATFNNDVKDYRLLQMADSSVTGSIWANPISSKVGNTIKFVIYYHNTSTVTAQNTIVRIDEVSNTDSTLTFKAYLTADNAATVQDLGTVTVASANPVFSFSPVALLYSDQMTFSSTASPIQKTANPVVGGTYPGVSVNIGNIDGSWAHQGYLVIQGTIQAPQAKFNTPMPEGKTTLVAANEAEAQGKALWNIDLTNAKGGDTVAFAVYYVNTVDGSTAKNAIIALTYPTIAQSKITVTSTLSADSITSITDQTDVAVTSAMSETLKFKNTALWYPDGATQAQTINLIVSSGKAYAEIGDVEGGLAHQGHLVFEATLTSTPKQLVLSDNNPTTPAAPVQSKTVTIVPKTGAPLVELALLAPGLVAGVGILKNKQARRSERKTLKNAIADAKKKEIGK